MGQWCSEPSVAVGGLGELNLPERALLQQAEHELVNGWSDRFDQVQGKRLATPGVVVDDAHARIEPDHLAGQDRLDLQEGIYVVQDGIGRTFRFPVGVARCQHRSSTFVAGPVGRDPSEVLRCEPGYAFGPASPCAEVDAGCTGFQLPYFVDALR